MTTSASRALMIAMKVCQLLGMQVHVGVEKCDALASRVRRTANERVALPLVAIAADDAHVIGPRSKRVAGSGMRSVEAAVVDDHDLEIRGPVRSSSRPSRTRWLRLNWPRCTRA